MAPASNVRSMSRRAAIAGTLAAVATSGTTPAIAQSGAMDALVRAAKADGSVTIDGPPIDTVRQALVKGFQDAYGIPVTYISSGSSASGARVRAERAAGKFILDVLVSGSDTSVITFLPSGWLDRVEPVLVAPDVIDRRKWKGDHLWYEDDGHVVLRLFQFVNLQITINTKLIARGEATTWRSLLDPKWQGKMIVKDPGTAGAGATLIGLLYTTFGPDYVRKLYIDQKPIISRDPRQAMQWLAQGTYPLLIGSDPQALDEFQRLGYPIEPYFPNDAPTVLTGGYGVVSLVNKAPHPNAAKLFVNWIAGRAGQQAFANAARSVSLRNDITYDSNYPSYVFPRKGVNYVDVYDFTFVTKQRDPAIERARALLGE
jgi:iron(III) transport system substrate-binding protein